MKNSFLIKEGIEGGLVVSFGLKTEEVFLNPLRPQVITLQVSWAPFIYLGPTCTFISSETRTLGSRVGQELIVGGWGIGHMYNVPEASLASLQSPITQSIAFT